MPIPGNQFVWKPSAVGVEVEMLAAGVGLIWNRNGAAARSEVGTSFAAQVAAN